MILHLGGCEMVLGIQFLINWREIKCNFFTDLMNGILSSREESDIEGGLPLTQKLRSENAIKGRSTLLSSGPYRITTSFQSKWLPKLLGFDYEIEYKKGKENVVVDALSMVQQQDLSAYPSLLQPLQIPNKVWQDISMNFIESLPMSQNKTVILVVVDRLIKYAHFIPLSHPFTTAQVAQAFLDNVYKLHGLPSTIVSDRDKVFLSLLWQSLFKMLKVQLCTSIAYHSSSSSSSSSDNEVQNCSKQCLESFKILQKNFDSEREKHSRARLEIQGYELALESLESRILRHEKNELAWGEKYEFQNYELKCREVKIDNLKMELEKVVKERHELKVKIEKWEESSKSLNILLNSQMSAHVKNGLRYV
ncbi:retrotransposable element Tf2 [Tanacetum coccineum]